MTSCIVRHKFSVAALVLALALPFDGHAKGYSSGGHSYSSHSSSSGSSHSFSSGSGRSFSSGSTRSSSSGGGSSSSRSSSTRTFNSGGGKSYTSGSSSSGDRKGYSSSKSYTSGSGTTFSSDSSKSSSSSKSVSKPPSSSSSSSSGSSGLTFDSSAARARKEQASKSDFSRFQESQKPPVIPRTANDNSYAGRPIPNSTRSYTRTVYVPDYTVIRTRPSRVNIYFGPYAYRPWIYYNDPYSSLFWWWLLDRSIDEQAYWAYHHRYDMDPGRYNALMASNQQLQNRVSQLEAQQVARDPSYTPPSLDSTNRDLMYSDQYVNQSYQNRSTPAGRIAFWVFAVPLGAGVCAFFVWLIWFKRWQPSTA